MKGRLQQLQRIQEHVPASPGVGENGDEADGDEADQDEADGDGTDGHVSLGVQGTDGHVSLGVQMGMCPWVYKPGAL